MNPKYGVEHVGEQFIVVRHWGEIVGSYPSEEEAQQNIERCKREDTIPKTARVLVGNAIKAYMQLNAVDRDTAERAIRDAADTTE